MASYSNHSVASAWIIEYTQENKYNGFTVRSYVYDSFDRISSIKSYDEPGSADYVETVYTYDSQSRVSSMQHKDGSSILESFTYTYDKENNILSTTHVNNLPEDGKKINETRVYTYDDYYNLSSSTKTDHLNDDAQLVTTYTYDQVGNRVSQTTGTATTTYTYNGLNQLLSKTDSDGTVNYTYDGRGNQILEQNTAAGTSTEMKYAVTGEMTELTEYSGETATMTQNNLYDHNGIRIMKTEDGASRDYYYDRGACAFTMDGSNVSTANILTPQGSVAGSYRDSTYNTYLKNQQGSTTSIVKDDGTLSAAYDYSDFGETTEITESGSDNQVCYTGGIYDDETGLYYLNARYYDPELGRFISQDTYRGMPEESDQWHLYAYCANNPINYVDTSGHARYANTKKSSSYSFWFKTSGSAVKFITFTLTIRWTINKNKIKKNSISSTLTYKYNQPTRRITWRYKNWSRSISMGRNNKNATHIARIMVEELHSGILKSSRVKAYIYGTGKSQWFAPEKIF